MSFTVVIPARYGSTRFPGKALALIGGTPMVLRVHSQAAQSGARRVLVATDDRRIHACCIDAGVDVVMTSDRHPSGTDRLAEVVEQLQLPDDEVVVNVQGDEPLMPSELVDQVGLALLNQPQAAMATLCQPLSQLSDFVDPNVVKVVRDESGQALYFSRAPIPYPRDLGLEDTEAFASSGCPAARHIGIYAYRAGLLREFVRWAPVELERCEMLEQLRMLAKGVRIVVELAQVTPPPEVNTPADLERVNQLLGD
ncbi:MAG: 3-deoxy-manno-octulosonate cytidylyltransferase [Pseudomonadota bacterium]|nr:3-deoxy-manno-octulosonate cytidylyltransferase [Pseudomonadota bacterium]